MKAFLSTLCCACLSVPAGAQVQPELSPGMVPQDDAATNTSNADNAIEFAAGYKADFLRVLSGGLERGGKPMGHLDLKLTADLDEIAGWSGTTAFVNFLHDHGETLNAQRVGSALGVSNIEVPVDTSRFFHAWIQKEWLDGGLSLLAGLYPIDSEFQVLESAGLFVQPPYGPTAELSLTRGPSIFNTSAFGVRARWLAESRSVYLQAAVLDGIPGNPNRPRGTHVRFDDGDGTMSIAEIGYQPKASENGSEGAEIAKYALGAWGYSTRVDDLVDVDANGNLVPRRSRGAYLLAEKSLWRSGGGADLNGFLRYSATDGDSTPIEATFSIGLMVASPFPSRPDDSAGIAYTHAAIGEKYRAQQLAAGTPAAAYESSWELTYRYAARPWLFVQPLVQSYRNPGASPAVKDATVAGVRIEVAL